MRLIGSLGLVLMVVVLFDSCFEAPHFADTPVIVFDKVIFKKGVPETGKPPPADSLIITMNFKDGDGDLGLSADDIFSPFNDKYYYRFPDNTLVDFNTRRTVPGYDTLPDMVYPYNCTNWEITYDSAGNTTDTVYFQLNPFHYNIFVDFYIKRNDASNTFDKFDLVDVFRFPNCQVSGFNARFPILAKDVNQHSPQEGQIRYSMQSHAFQILFSIKVLQLRVWILDRALHRSNVITTGEFQLQSILQPS